MKVSEHAPGSFCWAELVTNDEGGSKAFYTGLFGWAYQDNDMGPDGVYTMYRKGDGTVGAQYRDVSGKTPPHWGLYITVRNVDETVQQARELGANVLAEPFDVMSVGRMAVVQDPTGAVFNVWQPKQHIGYEVIDEPGAVCWNELNTRDAEAALRFYSALFGWVSKGGAPDGSYIEIENGGKMIAGIFTMTTEVAGIPPHWMVYFQVENVEESAAKAKALEGRILMGPKEVPGGGRFAVVQDPQSVVFGIYQPA